MAVTVTNLADSFEAWRVNLNLAHSQQGDLTILTTTDKTSIVAAINELDTGLSAANIKSAYESNADTNEFSDAEQTKLSGIETSATADQTGAEIKSAYEAEANAFTDTKNTKLSGIETSATADQTGAEIKSAYEAESNAFTDTKNTKLSGITTGANVVENADNTVRRINLQDVGEITNAIGSVGGGTQDIDITLGNSVSATIDTSATTFTISNPTASDEGCGLIIVLTNGGSQTVTWPASVKWPGATAPELTAAGTDLIMLHTITAGTTWLGGSLLDIS